MATGTAGLRVLQAMAGGAHGGAEYFFERLATAFQKRSVAQKVAIRTDPARAGRLKGAGVDVVELAFGGPLDLWTKPGLRRLAADYKPHIVLTWMNRATTKMPKGDYIHIARLGGYYKIKNYRHCDYLIGCAPDIVRWLVEEQGWPKKRAICIPNFVDTAKMAPVERTSLDTPPGKKLVVTMGRLHVNKAFDVLLRAMAKLPDVYLWLAGSGPEEASLMALANELGLNERVRFLGWRDDMPALLAAADVFVCPSRHEPFGNVVPEAWASDVPVVSTASQGPSYMIKSEESGILVGIDQPDELAEAMRKVLDDEGLARRLVAGGRSALETRFSEARIVDEYLEFFERCLKSSAK